MAHVCIINTIDPSAAPDIAHTLNELARKARQRVPPMPKRRPWPYDGAGSIWTKLICLLRGHRWVKAGFWWLGNPTVCGRCGRLAGGK
jgi:hypothetical protein